MIPDEIYFLPMPEQLSELDCQYGIANLLKLDILREMGPWGTMLVLRSKVHAPPSDASARN
ncbi:MAG TPA: hypothetical protein VNX86_15275 [Rhizomicrobium sp.]|jgi:hypothetical protein|nr:hypothetical protein [Rhizomicrobium sp.]